jgi:thermostable 8-oxoguanine DNA glycosylase
VCNIAVPQNYVGDHWMSKRKLARKREAEELDKFKRRFAARELSKGRKVNLRSSQEKMSEVIEQFIEPYKDSATTPEDYGKLIGLAILAWNASLLEGAERQAMLDQMMNTLSANDKEARKALKEVLDEMMKRKAQYFSENKRIIVDYQLSETQKGIHLSVASTL